MHVNATSIWNGGQMWRLELIGNFDHNTVQKGGIFYIWSMMQVRVDVLQSLYFKASL